jgi:hypothetical protein
VKQAQPYKSIYGVLMSRTEGVESERASSFLRRGQHGGLRGVDERGRGRDAREQQLGAMDPRHKLRIRTSGAYVLHTMGGHRNVDRRQGESVSLYPNPEDTRAVFDSAFTRRSALGHATPRAAAFTPRSRNFYPPPRVEGKRGAAGIDNKVK